MKFFKTVGLAALVVGVMMLGGPGGATATILTSPSGTEYKSSIALELVANTKAAFKSSFIGEIICRTSLITGEVKSQGPSVTARVDLSTLDFFECSGPFSTLKAGSFEIHTELASANGNGTLTSNGTEVTVEVAGLHCIFTTSSTDIGKVTGGTPATLTALEAAIPRTGGRSGAFCGSSTTFSATYRIVTPEALLVD